MKKTITILQYLTLAALGFLLFIGFFYDRVQLPAWWQVMGRSHVMWLHFPIAWLLVVMLMDLWPNNRFTTSDGWRVIRLALLLATLLTAITGMLLQLEGNIIGSTLENHRRSGLALGLAVAMYVWAGSFFAASVLFRRIAALFIIGLLIFTAHQGATLTHGADFLSAPLKKNLPTDTDITTAQVWRDVVYPVLKTKCGDCHMGGVQKGGLSMNDSLTIWKGGKEGRTIVAGNSTASNLIHRIMLPLEDKKHMPEANKPQLTQAEIQLLQAWIQAGATFSSRVIDLPASDTFQQLARQRLELLFEKTPVVYSFSAPDAGAIQVLNDNYRVVQSLGKDIPAIAVSFYGSSNFSSLRLKELKAVQTQIIEMNLAKMPLQPVDVEWISQFPHLQKLNLNYTPVSDEMLALLSKTTSLQSLAITGTRVTASGIEKFLRQHPLEELYVWDVRLTDAEIKRLQVQFPQVKLQTGFRGGDSILLTLNEPLIAAQEGIFTDQLVVPVKHVIKGVDVYYTLDGSVPDSNSKRYTEPLIIAHSGTLRVKAYKKGWLSSNVVSRSFLQAGYRISKTEFLLPADEKYRDNAGTVLQDFDVGDPTDFSTKWLGFQKNDAQVVFDVGKQIVMREVSVNSLTHTAAHIFPPVFVKVWGSNDGQAWKLLQTISPEKAMPTTPIGANLLKASFSPVAVRYIKMQAHPLPALPVWHTGKGLPAWFFVSEVIIN
jgi:mono/diheme cytochrome c family protein